MSGHMSNARRVFAYYAKQGLTLQQSSDVMSVSLRCPGKEPQAKINKVQ